MVHCRRLCCSRLPTLKQNNYIIKYQGSICHKFVIYYRDLRLPITHSSECRIFCFVSWRFLPLPGQKYRISSVPIKSPSQSPAPHNLSSTVQCTRSLLESLPLPGLHLWYFLVYYHTRSISWSFSCRLDMLCTTPTTDIIDPHLT